jgi:hypothetical protein
LHRFAVAIVKLLPSFRYGAACLLRYVFGESLAFREARRGFLIGHRNRFQD